MESFSWEVAFVTSNILWCLIRIMPGCALFRVSMSCIPEYFCSNQTCECESN